MRFDPGYFFLAPTFQLKDTRMSLTLHYHPLASFCWKALIALYENDIPFTPNSVNLGDATERAALLKLWPIGKFPVLRDEARVPANLVLASLLPVDLLDHDQRDDDLVVLEGKDGVRIV